MQQIKVNISNTGEIDYSVSGVKGGKCKDLTKLIDKLANVVDTKVTGEFCEVETGVQQKTGR